MLCTACGADNRRGARFCGQCGQHLSVPASRRRVWLVRTLLVILVVGCLCGLFVVLLRVTNHRQGLVVLNEALHTA